MLCINKFIFVIFVNYKFIYMTWIIITVHSVNYYEQICAKKVINVV